MDGDFIDVIKRWLGEQEETLKQTMWGETGTPGSQPGGMQWPDAPVFNEESPKSLFGSGESQYARGGSARNIVSGGLQEFGQVMMALLKATGYGLKDVGTELFGGPAKQVTREPKATPFPPFEKETVKKYGPSGYRKKTANTTQLRKVHRSTNPSVQLRRQLFGNRNFRK